MGISVAVVGLRFGADFVPIYRSHPDVEDVVLVDPDSERRRDVARRFGLLDGYATFEEALADPRIDAVHVLTPVSFHADMTVRALEQGRHVACAVPMATTLADIDRIIEAQARGGGRYMMMETAVYAREYAYAERMLSADEFGQLTLYRGHHVQNLDGYPPYWQGFPPMHYVTHAVSPLLGLLDTRVESVHCLGAGRLSAARIATGGHENPFPCEVGLFQIAGSELVAEVTVAFFQTARKYVEGSPSTVSEQGSNGQRITSGRSPSTACRTRRRVSSGTPSSFSTWTRPTSSTAFPLPCAPSSASRMSCCRGCLRRRT